MEDKINVPKSQFSIRNIVLIECNFSRAIVTNPIQNNNEVINDILIELNNTDISKDVFSVFLDYSFKIIHKDELIINIFIKYSAEFQAEGDISLKQKEDFANINAPAMIYPFIRETIASITAKALVGNILIPPVNFVKLYEDRKANENKQ